MSTIYSLDDIKEEIRKNVEYGENCLTAWQNVERIHKKDGTDFKNLPRNFGGCFFDLGHNCSVYVYFYTRAHGYVRNSINLGWLNLWTNEDTRITDPDQVALKIREQMDLIKKQIAENKRALELCDSVGKEFIETVSRALEKVKISGGGKTSLYLNCLEYVRNLY